MPCYANGEKLREIRVRADAKKYTRYDERAGVCLRTRVRYAAIRVLYQSTLRDDAMMRACAALITDH